MDRQNKKRILIINKAQFGYHIDTLKYAEYLRHEFDVTYMCFDTGKEKVVVTGVRVNYVEWTGSFIKKGRSFINACKQEMASGNYEKIFCVYFQGVSALVNRKNRSSMILDIRTGYVGAEKQKRWLFNSMIRFEAKFFRQVTVISESLAAMLHLKKFRLLPLGSDVLSLTDKDFAAPKLLYVGTLSGRFIHETVKGCKLFMDQTGVALSYDIFGDGDANSKKLLMEAIGNSTEIRYHGFRHHAELSFFFDTCNAGVSFVPITAHFNVQPPTKTFEYMNAGMVCIATETNENKKIVTPANGILCQDNAVAFSDALHYFMENKNNYSSAVIRSTIAGSTWKNIVDKYLLTILNSN